MNNINYFMSLYLFLISCLIFSFFYKHLLLMIISLEFMMISIIYNMMLIIMMLENFNYLIIFFLVMVVCEGVLALSLIVMMVRFYGNDYINSMMIIKW